MNLRINRISFVVNIYFHLIANAIFRQIKTLIVLLLFTNLSLSFMDGNIPTKCGLWPGKRQITLYFKEQYEIEAKVIGTDQISIQQEGRKRMSKF